MVSLLATWHTEGRRQPGVLGKDSSGKKLPGGPYTGPQAAASALVFACLEITKGYWSWLVGDKIIFEWGLILGLSYAAMRWASRIDYTNLSVLWRLYGGIRAAVEGVMAKGPVSSATGRALDYSGAAEQGVECLTVAYRERGASTTEPVVDAVPAAEVGLAVPLEQPVVKAKRREVTLAGGSTSLVEQLLGAEAPAPVEPPTRRVRPFLSHGRRQPQMPAVTPLSAASPAAVETPMPVPTAPAVPRSALQDFLAAAGRLPGEH